VRQSAECRDDRRHGRADDGGFEGGKGHSEEQAGGDGARARVRGGAGG
jgi:hypothetical protein